MTDDVQPSLDAGFVGTGRRAKGVRSASSKRRSELLACVADPDRVLFLDIESTGLSRYYDNLTLVGYAFGGIYRVHIAGDDGEDLRNHLAMATALVTFNGTLFDIPFLKKTFEDLTFPPIHIDLRYAARRIGLVGGQKSIERQIGISLRHGLEDVDGRVAVLLWHQYLRGDENALRRLIAYNRADVQGMFAILDRVLERHDLPLDLFTTPPNFSELFCDVTEVANPNSPLPKAARLGKVSLTFEQVFANDPAANATVVGIDLTGSEKRPSGFCILRGMQCETAMLATDQELVEGVLAARPSLVSIDSPLSLPHGRTRVTDDDPARSRCGIMRLCERELKRRGINVYPCLLPSMQRLTERGMRLARQIRELGIPVIESYPGAAQDIMGIPRKGAGETLLREGLLDFGLTGAFAQEPVKHDELDAITSALVGTFYLSGQYEALEGPEEGALIIPRLGQPPSA